MSATIVVGIGSAAVAAVSAAAERRSHWFTFAAAIGSIVAAGCAFFASLWYLGVGGVVAYLVAMRRWVDRQERELKASV